MCNPSGAVNNTWHLRPHSEPIPQQFLKAQRRLLAVAEIFQLDLSSLQLFGAQDDGKGDAFFLCIFELLVEFRVFVVEFAGHAPGPELPYQSKGGPGFGIAQVEEEDLGARVDIRGKELQLFHHVIDPVDSEGDTHSGNAGNTEESREIVIAAAAADAA